MPFRTTLPPAVALAVIALCAAPAQTESAQNAPSQNAPAHPDPIVITSDQLKWTGNPGDAQGAAVFGDPTKAGPFIFFVNWTANGVSKPHYHTKTRTLIVLKGHWDFGSGPHFDLNNMKVIPEGGVVIVPAGSILYDGCKLPPCMVEIVGDGGDTKFMVDENGQNLPVRQRPAR
jgi:hypothetical protein